MSDEPLAYHEVTGLLKKAEEELGIFSSEVDGPSYGLAEICRAIVRVQQDFHARLGRAREASRPERRGWKRFLPGWIDVLLSLGGAGITVGFWEAWEPLGWISGGGMLLLVGGVATVDRARRLRMQERTRRV
jgi:hypothetical protein